MRTLSALITLTAVCCLPGHVAAAKNAEFIFSGGAVVCTREPKYVIRFGDQFFIEAIKERFSPYSVEISNECDGFCVVVASKNGSINIFGEANAKKVLSIVSRGEGIPTKPTTSLSRLDALEHGAQHAPKARDFSRRNAEERILHALPCLSLRQAAG